MHPCVVVHAARGVLQHFMHYVLWFVLGWIPVVIATYRGHRFTRIVGTAAFVSLYFHWLAWAVVVAFALLGPKRPDA